ncbi:uncharacterized protein LOC111330315 [Stylophora pistillata]|uniref:uncharacterized protein LOC111330315 n=1 Tax=Stylophora pistillata TaxID=50429 RepID=UPI000C048C61|nr:uncharacterized protein LOC111330315 [Stylophora pistillata]
MTSTGVAFSGGGIRSAALCSGVLRRLLQKETIPDFLSCNSGGGYTGTAYLDWKYRNEQKDDPKWHREFFTNMRRRVGIICDWQKPLQGILDVFVILFLFLLVVIVLPVSNWSGFAIPVAFIIDRFFGRLMRIPFTCPDEKKHNFTKAEMVENPAVSVVFNMSETVECVPKFSPEMHSTLFTFAFLFLLFLFFFVMKKVVRPSLEPFAIFLSNFSGFVFAMVFLPWFIEEFVVVTPYWLNALILVLSIFLWLGIPPLRDKASLAMAVYFYAYAVKWRVYKTDVLSVKYDETTFYLLVWISGILIWINPLLGVFQRSALHAYNRWRLQRAFYSPETTSATLCSGFTCQDFIPLFTCCSGIDAERLNQSLTLDDLAGISPEYICNTTVHEWRVTSSHRESSYELFTMAPSRIERIDNTRGPKQFEGRLHPADIKLADAMATSAAAVSYRMGKHTLKPLQTLQIMLGIGMGTAIKAEPRSRRGCFSRFVAVISHLVLALPILLLPLIPILGGSEVWNERAVIFFLVFFCVSTLIAVMPTGAENPRCWQHFVRWCIVNVYHVRVIRELLRVVNEGPTPPPILYLSDGGHIENLALLPLLKRKLKKILVVDGGAIEWDKGMAGDLLISLQQARQKLRCSFIGMDGRDVIEDIRAKVIDRPAGMRPRSYRFKVEYYDLKEDGGEEKAGDGEVLYILPRHPDDGLQGERKSWDELHDHTKTDIEAALWGTGPDLEAEEVERLTFCCSECCHCSHLQYLSHSCCGIFPYHSTSNQLFTPAQFSAYHREGYHACVEARAIEFLKESEEISEE